MDIPSELQQLIKDSLESIRHHPKHDLNLGYRQAIWAALGPYYDEPHTKDSSGYKRRAYLANITVRHVLPIWNQAFPNDDTPQRILAEAEQVVAGTVSKEVAQKDFENFLEYMNELGYSTSDMAFMAGYGAVQALATALEDESFDPDHIDYDVTDNKDVEGNDASFAAACAYANGPVWKTKSEANTTKRQEFWEWWLIQAVPKAWEVVP